MIHGGLWLNFTIDKVGVEYSHCCLSSTSFLEPDATGIWNNRKLMDVRKINLANEWHVGCNQCKNIEQAGKESFRTWYNHAYGVDNSYPGPMRIDIKMSNSCNLACRICGSHSSSYWAKHLKDNNLSDDNLVHEPTWKQIQAVLDNLDLSRLDQIVFCGGETLLGNSLYVFLDYMLQRRPDGEMTVSFQTNGTQKIPKKYHELLSRFRLIKLNFSIDGTHDRFEYQRWPARWNEVTDNISELRETVPVNTMFLVEQTLSIFNLFYRLEVIDWINTCLPTNRLGDAVDYREHFATGTFAIKNLSRKYADALGMTDLARFIPTDLDYDPTRIAAMIKIIEQFDKIRGQNWAETFPEIHGFYH